jgi:O-antigen ligase
MINFNLKINTYYIFKLIFLFFPFFLISGPFFPDLMVVLMAIYFLFYCYLNKKFIFFFKNNVIIFFLIFYFYININSLFSYLPLVSFSTSLPYIRMILFAIFLAYLLKKIINLKKIIFFSFIFSYFFLFIDSLIQIKTGYNILGYPIVTERVASLFRDKLVMGSYVSRTLPILIAISYFETFKYEKFLRAFCICLAGALVFFSAERVSMFYFFLTVILYLILLPNKKTFFFHAGLLASLFLLLIFFKPSSVNRLYNHTLHQINEKKSFLFSERHEMHFVTAYRMFKQKKFFGHGINSFRYLCDQDPYSTKDLIIKSNSKFSPIDGYFYYKKGLIDNKNFVYFIPETLILEFQKKVQVIEDLITLGDKFEIFKASESFNSFIINNSIINWNISQNILHSIMSGSLVKNGEYVFAANDFENGCNTHPHSFHLQILSELGLFGYFFLFTFFLYLIYFFLKNLINIFFKNKKKIKEKNNNLYCIFIVISLIQFLFPIIPSGNIFNNWLSVFFYFKLAFLLNFIYYKK